MKKRDYEIIKLKYINKYQDKILNLREDYINSYDRFDIKRFLMFNSKYRNYIIKMIKEISLEFKKIYKTDFCVTLTGSLGRNSNNLYSDVDINYLTLEDNRDVIIEIEEKINYIIQEVLKFRGKDKIHSMVVYLSLINNKIISLKNEKIYELTFEDGIINVPCRNNANKLIYETYNSTRSLIDVIDYFNKNDNENIINEWTYCFKFVNSNKYEKIYQKRRNVCYNLSNILKFKQELLKNIDSNNIYINKDIKKIENDKLKKIYKTDVLFNFYKLLAIDFRIEKNIKNFTIDCFYFESKLLNKKIFNCFYKYLSIIQNLQYILDLKDIDLSSHSQELLDLEMINKVYKNIFARKNIIDDLNICKEELYRMCYNYLGGKNNEFRRHHNIDIANKTTK